MDLQLLCFINISNGLDKWHKTLESSRGSTGEFEKQQQQKAKKRIGKYRKRQSVAGEEGSQWQEEKIEDKGGETKKAK